MSMVELILIALSLVLFGSVDDWFIRWVGPRFFYWGVTLLLMALAAVLTAGIPSFSRFPLRKNVRFPWLVLYVLLIGLRLCFAMASNFALADIRARCRHASRHTTSHTTVSSRAKSIWALSTLRFDPVGCMARLFTCPLAGVCSGVPDRDGF
jgi:hypothetical protein